MSWPTLSKAACWEKQWIKIRLKKFLFTVSAVVFNVYCAFCICIFFFRHINKQTWLSFVKNENKMPSYLKANPNWKFFSHRLLIMSYGVNRLSWSKHGNRRWVHFTWEFSFNSICLLFYCLVTFGFLWQKFCFKKIHWSEFFTPSEIVKREKLLGSSCFYFGIS